MQAPTVSHFSAKIKKREVKQDKKVKEARQMASPITEAKPASVRTRRSIRLKEKEFNLEGMVTHEFSNIII